MDELRWGFLHLVFAAILLVETQASGKFTILLIDFSNPSHKVYNGDCCDNVNFCSWNECDNFFRFCAALLGSTEQCSLGGLVTTKVLGDDSFRFPGKGQDLGGELTNPITYSFQEWKGASVLVEVWDNDSGHIVGKLDDFVDKYNLVVTNKPAKNKQSSLAVSKKLCGKRSCVNIKIEVYCDDKYLIPQCTEYCVSRDSDMEGHYTCDYDRGLKVCLEGWFDIASNCTRKKKVCTPRNDTAGHYDCNPESGEKMCHTGWMGSNCTVVYVPSSVRPLTSTPTYHIQTEHAQQSTTRTPTWSSTTYTADHTTKTVGASSSFVSQDPMETSLVKRAYSSLPLRLSSNVEAFVSTTRSTDMHGHTVTEKLQSFIAMTTVLNKETSLYQLIKTSTPQVEDSPTLTHHTTSILTSDILERTRETVLKSVAMTTTLQKSVELTSAYVVTRVLSSSSAHASSIIPTAMTGPTTDWDQEVIINMVPSRNWTNEAADKLKTIIKDQLNEFCKKQPLSCNIDPDIALNSSSLFNTTDVLLDVRNGSTGDDVTVSIRVKIPTTIPGVSGGIFIPSIVVKQVITANKDIIEKQTGLTLSLENSNTTVTMTTNPSTKPLTTSPAVDIETRPTDSLITGLDDRWTFIIGAIGATLLLLVITLCFTFHMNRSNKAHPLNPVGSRAVCHKEDPEMTPLTTLQLVSSNKALVKIQTNDASLRSRTSSTNADNRLALSPFTPDYTNT